MVNTNIIQKLGIFEKANYSPELRTLLSGIISRHVKTIKGANLFLSQFERDLPKDITFKDLLSVNTTKTTTGHPTEPLSAEGIRGIKVLCALLDKGMATGRFDRDAIRGSVANLAEELGNIPKKKVIEQETTDSLVGSENLYDSLEIISQRIFKAAKKGRLIKLKDSHVSVDDLRKCNDLMEVRTWSPGDSDGKPGQDYKTFEDGVRRNTEAIYRQYIIKLAEISSGLDEGEVKDKSRDVLKSLISTMVKKSTKSSVTEKLKKHAEAAGNGTYHLISEVMDNLSDADTYHDSTGVVEALINLKTLGEKKVIQFLKKDKRDVLTKLDNLIISAQNFGEHAQKIEFRQNADVFRKVAQRVRKLAQTTKYNNAVDFRMILEEQCWLIGDTEYNRIKDILHNKGDAGLTDIEKSNFYFMDTIRKLGIIAKNPEAFKSILIAECGEMSGEEKKRTAGDGEFRKSVSDFTDAKYLFDVMTAGLHTAAKAREKIKVTPLFEYNSQIKDLPQFLKALISDPEILHHFRTHGLEIMIAGSDSFKSAGSSVVIDMKEGIAALNAICKTNDIDLTVYYGTGSGLHRNIVNMRHEIPFLRTIQGIEMMRRPAKDLACESLRILANRLRLRKQQQHEKITLTQAVVDIGNSAASVNHPGNEAPLRERTAVRYEEYLKKYNHPWFATFVESCLPGKIESRYSLAARPASRVGGSSEAGPKAKRAIGYGQMFNNAGWGPPQLFTDISDLMFAKKDGYFKEDMLKDAYKLYIGKNHLRDIVNRGIYNLALSSPATGWQYVAARYGLDIKVTRNYNDIACINIDGKEYKISDFLLTKGGHPSVIEMHKQLGDKPGSTEAIYSAAFLEIEHQKACRSVYQMLSYGLYDRKVKLGAKDKEKAPLAARNFGKDNPDFTCKEAISPEQIADLLGVINKTLGAELREAKEEAGLTRGTLLATFRKEVKGEKLMLPEELAAYHAFTSLRQRFELPPVTYLFPELSIDKELALAV